MPLGGFAFAKKAANCNHGAVRRSMPASLPSCPRHAKPTITVARFQPDMFETRLSLLARVRDPHDAAAWAEFVGLYQPLVTAYLRKRGVPEHEVDDIVQEVFTRLVPAMARFELVPERGRFRTWLWQVTHSALMDHVHRRSVRQRSERAWAEDQVS